MKKLWWVVLLLVPGGLILAPLVGLVVWLSRNRQILKFTGRSGRRKSTVSESPVPRLTAIGALQPGADAIPESIP